MGGGTTRNM